MPFYFRKLRRALRLLPNTQKGFSLAYSTRVNERDTANGTVSLTNRSTSSSTLSLPLLCDDPAGTLDLPVIVVPPSLSLPISSQDLRNMMVCADTTTCKHHTVDEKVYTPSSIKSVNLTTDDIVVHPFFGSITCDSLNRVVSLNKRVPVDIIQMQPALAETHPLALDSTTASTTEGSTSSPLHRCHSHPQTMTAQLATTTCDSSCSSFVQPQYSHYCRASTNFAVSDIHSSNNFSALPDMNTLFFSASGSSRQADSSDKSSSSRPSAEQMFVAREKCEQLVQNMLQGSSDHSVLHKDVVLENNLFGKNKVCRGLTSYYLEMLKLRIQVHTRNSKASMEILNITSVEQTGVIRIHWRMMGVSQVHVLKFWRFFAADELISSEEKEWLEAFSYFHIGKDGLIHKHRIDRMLPDDGAEPSKLKEKLQEMLSPAKPLVN